MPRSMTRLMILLLFASLEAFAQSTNTADPLKPYTACELPGDLRAKEVTRGNLKQRYREVSTEKGTERVSVLDGYRVMFAYNDVPYYFANVKIEVSDPQSYAEDKAKVIDDLKHSAKTERSSKVLYADKSILNGFEHYGIDRDAIDAGGTIGIHVLFYDPHHLIVTIYLLNQDDKNRFRSQFGKRRFHNIDEYRALKDDFLQHYSECLKSVAEAQH
jgi:hypothetical protein